MHDRQGTEGVSSGALIHSGAYYGIVTCSFPTKHTTLIGYYSSSYWREREWTGCVSEGLAAPPGAAGLLKPSR